MNKLGIVKNNTDKYIFNKQEKEKIIMKPQQRNANNNSITISGEIVTSPEYSHEIFGECFYILKVSTKRTSGTVDILPVEVSERLINIDSLKIGQYIVVDGQIRTCNKICNIERKSKLIVSVFAQELQILDNHNKDINEAHLNGFLCRNPIHRTTPLGRELCEILLAVNRLHRKSDYIPSIVWGRNARYMSSLEIGTQIKVSGRLQSRIYTKKIMVGEGTLVDEERTAYELSVSKMDCL